MSLAVAGLCMRGEPARVAVVLSGCGVYDGTEVHEAVLTLLAIEEAGAEWDCFAPDVEQAHVIDHSKGEVSEGVVRNVLVESARISRGEITDLAEFDAGDFDALVFPGGFGAAKNLSDFAFRGSEATVNSDVMAAVEAMRAIGKPLCFICITPASVAAPVLSDGGLSLTIGDDAETAEAIEGFGARHVVCSVESAIVDEQAKVVSTPAYMLGPGVADVAKGIREAITETLRLI